jgi:hypothetical protein
MGLFPISSGGGQFTSVPLTLWYKFATRGCRWICYSNCKQNLGVEILAQRPHVGGGIFYTEFIQICTISVVDFDKKHHIHQIL